MKNKLQYFKTLLPFRSAVLALFFGFLAMLTIYWHISFYLTGASASSDPREIFNALGGALTGPIGAIVIGFLSTAVGGTQGFYSYVLIQHIISALWMGIAYKKIVYERLGMPDQIIGWLFLQFVYSFIIYIPGFYFLFLFSHAKYIIFVGDNLPFWQGLLKLYSGWLPEIIFTAVMTTLLLMALPDKYRIPLWGNPINKVNLKRKYNFFGKSYSKYFKKNYIAIRLSIWFIILFTIPLLYLSVTFRNYFADFVLKGEGKRQYEIVKNDSEYLTNINKDSIINTFSNHQLNNGNYLLLLDGNLNQINGVKYNLSFDSPPVNTDKIKKAVIAGKDSGFYLDEKLLIAVGFEHLKSGYYLLSVSNPEYSRIEIEQLVYPLIKNIGLALLMISILGGVIIWYIVGNPLRKITAVANEISHHNYDAKVDDSVMSDEVGVLAQSINIMKDNVKIAEDMLSNILNSVPQSIFWKDNNSVYLGCNNVFIKSAGLANTNQVIGKNDFDMPWKKEESEAFILDDAQIIRDKKPKYHIIEKLTDAEGNNIWIDTTKIPLFDTEGKIYGLLGVFEDITDRVKFENKLKESEILHRLITENVPDVIWTWNFSTGRFSYVSDSVQKLRGYSPAEVMKQSLAESMTPESYKIISDIITTGLSSRIPGDTEQQIIKYEVDQPCKDGSIVPTEVRSVAIFNEEGSLIEIIGISRDITEQKRIENELIHSRANLKALIESTTDLIWLVDINYKLLTYNQIFEEHFLKNYGIKVFIGATPEDVVPPDKAKNWRLLFDKAIDEGQYSIEYFLTDGRILEMAFHPVIIDKKIIGVSVFGKDITSQINAQNNLKKSESHYRALAENTPDVIAEFDENCYYLFINSAITKITNYKPEDFIGKRIGEIEGFTQEQTEFREDRIKQAFKTGLPFESEFEFLSPKGKRIFEWRIYPVIDSEGAVQSVMSINRDITERRMIDEEIIKNKTFIERINEQSPDIIYIYDVEQDRNIYTNKDIGLYLGYQKDELLYDDKDFFSKLIHPDDIRQFDKYYERVVQWESEYTFEFEYRIKAKNGDWKWFRGKEKEFQRNERKQIVSLIGTVRDVTENKKFEQSLIASEQRFKV